MKSLNNYKKYTKILLFDTENVGAYIPKVDDTLAIYLISPYLFPKSQKIIKKYLRKHDIVISIDKCYNHTKECLDFILVSKLTEILKETSKKQELYVISGDKGFDDVILFLSKENPSRTIARYDTYQDLVKNKTPMSQLIDRTPNKIVEKIHIHKLENVLSECDTMEMLKNSISQKVFKNIFRLRTYKDLLVEYDFYKNITILYLNSNGSKDIICKSQNIEKIFTAFEKECLSRYQVAIKSKEIYNKY